MDVKLSEKKKYVKMTVEFEEYNLKNPEDINALREMDNLFFKGAKLIKYEGREYRLPVSYQFFVDKKTRIVKFVKEY